MKKLLLGVALTLVVGSTAFASVPELFLKSGANTQTVVGGGGTVTYNNPNFGGWNVVLAFGSSHSPSLEPGWGLQLISSTIECNGGATCADLNIWLSDVNFTATNGFQVGYSMTSVQGTASTSMNSWVGLGNTYFQAAGGGAPLTTGGTALPSIGPFTTTDGQNKTAVLASLTTPYSLTLEALFNGCSGTNCASYGSTAAISAAVPEPASVALFGTLLGLCATRLLRRRKSV